MLTIKHGDVFQELKQGDVFVHGCNSKAVMGSGVAKIVKDKWPKAYQLYKQEVLLGKLKIGQWNAWWDTSKDIVIVNLITQQEFGRDKAKTYVDYNAVKNGLLSVVSEAGWPDGRIVFPFIGGGLANGDREILLDIFHEVFDNADIEGVLVIN
jgi:O-acetyl-ADP-ribose deacetylase (regulator of RNase III)